MTKDEIIKIAPCLKEGPLAEAGMRFIEAGLADG